MGIGYMGAGRVKKTNMGLKENMAIKSLLSKSEK